MKFSRCTADANPDDRHVLKANRSRPTNAVKSVSELEIGATYTLYCCLPKMMRMPRARSRIMSDLNPEMPHEHLEAVGKLIAIDRKRGNLKVTLEEPGDDGEILGMPGFFAGLMPNVEDLWNHHSCLVKM